MEETLFYTEIDNIQARHELFFPTGQKKFIRLTNENGRHHLYFSERYNLPGIITSEIQFAFKLAFLNEETRNKFVCGSCPFSTPGSNNKSHDC